MVYILVVRIRFLFWISIIMFGSSLYELGQRIPGFK